MSMITIITWGGLWGVFELTAGYLLHLLPFSVGWLVWYPLACFFMMNVYRRTKRIEAVLLVGLLSAGIKMLNLFLPVRVDRVINPAISIVFEAVTLAAVIYIMKGFSDKKKRAFRTKLLAVLCMNTGWRVLYMVYVLFFVPDWMREISVVSSIGAFNTFFLAHNLLTSVVLLIGAVSIEYIFKPIRALENKLSLSPSTKVS